MSDELIELLRDVSSAFQMRLQEMSALDELRIASFQARLLKIIGRRPGCSQLELTSSTGRDKAQIARTVKELENRGFVVRAAHASEWRTQCLSRTEAGEKACALIEQQRAKLGGEILGKLTSEEKTGLRDALRKMKQALGS